MATVYLETSFVSACVSDRSDVASVYRRETSMDWWSTQRHHHDLFVSAEVIHELSYPDYSQSSAAVALIEHVPPQIVTPESLWETSHERPT